MYVLEKTLLAVAGIICFLVLPFIRGKDVVKAAFIFLQTQFFSWMLGLIVVQSGWLDYPVREFAKANATSFLFEYMLFPVMTIVFILKYPSNKSLIIRIAYYATVVSVFTFVEFIVEKYTLIIQYHAWKWYWTWVTVALTFYIVMVIYKWFFRIKKIFAI